MEYSRRSAAALVTAGVLAAGGVAAVAASSAQSSDPSPAGAQPVAAEGSGKHAALAATVRELLANTDHLHGRLADARREFAEQARELQRQRALARLMAYASAVPSSGDGSWSTPTPGSSPWTPTTTPSTPPTTDTATGASGTGYHGDDDDESGDDHHEDQENEADEPGEDDD